ncbi:MAG: hypothetical protein ACK499_03895 [Betaproteobacteria bacterium]|jgi:hypothetical protein
METASAQETEDAMWQGYVSAISCLLLALLLIMAILAISLVLASAVEQAAPEQQVQSSPTPTPTPTPPSPAKGARWVLNFPGQTVDIGPAQRAQFAAQLIKANPEGGWQVFAYSEPGSSTAQRLAYIRVLATRDLLIESGVAAKNIELQLLDTDPALTPGKNANVKAPATESMVYVKPGRPQEPSNASRKGQP